MLLGVVIKDGVAVVRKASKPLRGHWCPERLSDESKQQSGANPTMNFTPQGKLSNEIASGCRLSGGITVAVGLQ